MNEPRPGAPGLFPSEGAGGVRDLCPTLRDVRIRIGEHLEWIDAEILAYAHPIANGVGKLVALQHERAALVEALELIAVATERDIDRAARRRWLEMLLASAPACMNTKARQRIRHLIDGLSEPPPA